MLLEILTPEKRIYSGEVYGVQLPGVSGLFEVLNRHAPMVSALTKGKIKVLNNAKGTDNVLFAIDGGFVEILNNKATVLVEGVSELY
ncbi:MAG TPA: ATP synthase F1 subunit epsilon [Arachidicoccus sp.]|nr:ATP synthase F1 subunit epsilon [Arachidicoccus sp.]